MSTTQAAKSAQQIENHDMVVKLYDQYQYDHIVAIRRASKIQRELSRAEHEARRIEQHLRRIEAFCDAQNITLNKEGNEV